MLETARLFRAEVVDVAPDAPTVDVTGDPDKLEAFLEVVESFGIKELVQSGLVAIGRGTRSITDRAPALGLTGQQPAWFLRTLGRGG